MEDQSYIQHQLNNSPSKHTYSFAKGPRIQKTKRLYTDTFYQLPRTNSTTYCTFGKGNKIQLANKNGSPSPNAYKLKSEFEKSPKKGYSFGVGRNESPFRSFMAKAMKKDQSPGPQSYQIPSTLSKRAITIKKRYPNQNEKRSPTPGPNSYYPEKSTTQFATRHANSLYKNASSAVLKGRGHDFIAYESKNNLGPGQYDIDNKSPGKYYQSQYSNAPVRYFGTSARLQNIQQDHSKTHFPGPGQYQRFSQFGFSNKYKKSFRKKSPRRNEDKTHN